MKDLVGKDINKGDLLVCTDYNQTGLYMVLAMEVRPGSVLCRKLWRGYYSDSDIEVPASTYYCTRKTSGSHLYVVPDSPEFFNEMVSIGTTPNITKIPMGEVVERIRKTL